MVYAPVWGKAGEATQLSVGRFAGVLTDQARSNALASLSDN
jgi:hypothetical protein